MEFLLLGSLEVRSAGAPVPVASGKQRVVLATLLLRANEVVTVDELIDRLWDEDVPAAARGTAQAYVMRLRKVLGEGVIGTVDRGYVLTVDPDRLDLTRFRAALRRADEAAAAADRVAEAACLGAALDLWRGRPLSNVPSDLMHREEVPWLEELRLHAVERRVQLDVDGGAHNRAVAELRSLIAEHPLRERFWAQLMLALFRAGRQADALAAHRALTARLAEELGIDPGDEVRRLHLAILADDPALLGDRDTAPPQRGNLPPAAAHFVGRTAETVRAAGLLRPLPDRSSPRYVVLSGPPGVGKTALAVHVAHAVREDFPDGVLHVDLRGFSQQPPLTVQRALTRLLRGLGLNAEQVPLDEDAQQDRYASLLTGRRMLVVLDNAVSSDQVRPLLPGEPGCAALVTSRNDLRGLIALEGARRLALDSLPAADARRLLVDIVGTDIADAEPDAVAELVELCARLPLAVRIAGANLVGRAGAGVADHVAELRRANRLSALAVDDDEQAAVRTAFGLSYETLKPDERRMFRLLGLVPGTDFTPEAAAALADEHEATAATLLGRLVTANLVQQQGNRRHQLHDLLRLYARERAELEDPAEHRALALDRLYRHYLRWADAAAVVLNPASPRLPRPEAAAPAAFDGPARAVAWLSAERANLVGAVEFATAHPDLRPWSRHLADAVTGYLHTHRHDSDLLAVATAALDTARADGDRPAEATMLRALGVLDWSLGDYRRALERLRAALVLHREVGDAAGAGTALIALGVVHLEDGRLAEAARHFAEAAEAEVPAVAVAALARLGVARLEAGDLTAARAHLESALSSAGPLGLVHTEAVALNTLGAVHLRQGAFDEAIASHQGALERYQVLGSRHDQAEVLQNLAAVHRDARRFATAVEYGEKALALARSTGNLRFAADTLNTLASARAGQLDWDAAVRGHSEALGLSRRVGYRQGEITSLIGLAATAVGLGRAAAAIDDAGRAALLARTTGFRLREAQALTVLAHAEVDAGRPEDAAAHAAEALALHQASGNRLGIARAHQVLELVAGSRDPDRPEEAGATTGKQA
ncbi:BTAD domain-containing putative transcriptional regulator [Saccharothrix violaceirubra]|uniref:DNA-binding SARP family transcriptional activator/DNA polymerase III delta prime subunit n=1 Tax=Saccharothrix violaceirubra TaxID=413306 RepID=A0A7W7T3Z0_9PSEU|nr:BTAD domain-containing putative transcriptional regulator [Saccharothrix violaceirubra]MBB4965891.1 DNA-binding SARP family transcriptional activator/DNA polymerase III delta prime subunit [Saccharothrix violaceirubra]